MHEMFSTVLTNGVIVELQSSSFKSRLNEEANKCAESFKIG